MDGNTVATYTLIYRFLKQQSQQKAAEAVKRAAKSFVVLRDDIEQQSPSLEDIIGEWRAKQNTKSERVESSSEDTESSDDTSPDSEDSSESDSSSEDTSSSESDSSDDSEDSGEETASKKLPPKTAERDTSVTLSSDSNREARKQAAMIPKKTSTEDKRKNSGSDSSSSDNSDSSSSDSDSSSNDSASDDTEAESSSSSSSSPSSSDSSDEDKVDAGSKAAQCKTATKLAGNTSSASSESSSESEDDSKLELQQDTHIAKKRKTSEHGPAVTVPVTMGDGGDAANVSQIKEKLVPQVKERFQRVKIQNVVPELLLDNGYNARGGARNDYGERAHRDLIVTRGAGFRKEKNKKKRGSYRGGEITMENHSIKFDY